MICINISKNSIEYYLTANLSSNIIGRYTVAKKTDSGFAAIYEFKVSTELDLPAISYENSNYLLTVPEKVSILPIATNIISNCYVEPKLPSGIELDRKTCEITGNAVIITPSKVYTITPVNGAGNGTSAKLTIEVIDCATQGRVAYSLVYQTGSSPASNEWVFKTTEGKLIEYGDKEIYPLEHTDYFISGCAPSSDYVFEMRHASGSLQWTNDTLITISITGMSTFSFSKTNNEVVEEIIIAVDLLISSAGKWKIRDLSIPTANWYTTPYSQLTGFTEGILGINPAFKSATIYLATEFTPGELDEYAGFELSVTHQLGFILYLNGEEFFRKFLPASNVTYDTYATGQFQTITITKLLLPSVYLKVGKNTLSIEAHRMNTSTETLTMQVMGTKINDLVDGCIMLQQGRTSFSNSSGNLVEGYPPSNALDYDYSTEWRERFQSSGTSVKPFVEFSAPTNTYLWFNQLGWRAIVGEGSASDNGQPSKMTIYGLLDGIWEVLTAISRIVIQTEGQKSIYHLMNNKKLYSSFRFTIDGTLGIDSMMRIADVIVGACQKYYCEEDSGFQAASSGSRVSRPCYEGYTGTMFRKCGDGKNPSWSEIDKARCLPSPPSNFFYKGGVYNFITFHPYYEEIKPNIIFFGELRFEIMPKLPSGLFLDNSTGTISGVTAERSALKEYLVLAMDVNSENGIETTISIGVDSLYCPPMGTYPETQGGDTAEIQCPIGSSGKIYRKCNDGEMPQWGEEDKQCVDKSKLSSTSITLIAVFSVCSLVAIVAIALCVYNRFKASKRKTKRTGAAMRKNVGPGTSGMSIRSGKSNNSQKSVRL